MWLHSVIPSSLLAGGPTDEKYPLSLSSIYIKSCSLHATTRSHLILTRKQRSSPILNKRCNQPLTLRNPLQNDCRGVFLHTLSNGFYDWWWRFIGMGVTFFFQNTPSYGRPNRLWDTLETFPNISALYTMGNSRTCWGDGGEKCSNDYNWLTY